MDAILVGKKNMRLMTMELNAQKYKVHWWIWDVKGKSAGGEIDEEKSQHKKKSLNTSIFDHIPLPQEDNWLIDRSIDWLVDWLVSWLIDWLIQFDWLVNSIWLLDWLANGLIDFLSNWLIDWLIA